MYIRFIIRYKNKIFRCINIIKMSFSSESLHKNLKKSLDLTVSKVDKKNYKKFIRR